MTQPKKKMLTPRFSPRLVEAIKAAAEERGQSVNEFLKCAAVLYLDSETIHRALDAACNDYLRWSQNELKDYDANQIAYRLYTTCHAANASYKQ